MGQVFPTKVKISLSIQQNAKQPRKVPYVQFIQILCPGPTASLYLKETKVITHQG
jgi:hypothetical protein